MWLFTRYGFYSIACARKPDGTLDPQLLMIRARRITHLKTLQQRFRSLANVDIVTLPERDYRYRLIVPKELWARVVAELAEEQEWSNFKNEVTSYQGTAGSAYIRALHEVWLTMCDFQEGTPMNVEERLVRAVLNVYKKNREVIDPEKLVTLRWEMPDLIWELLLLSFSSMGNSSGMRLVQTPELHDSVRFDLLSKLGLDQRLARLRSTLKAAGVRWPNQKAGRLAENFDRIQREGGPESVKSKLSEQPGRDAKIKFLRTFRGIGDKYARNMMMDVYHEDFRESIAIDERIKKISKTLGLEFGTYDEAERFFLEIAHRAGINGWKLDRLLYLFTDQILASIAAY